MKAPDENSTPSTRSDLFYDQAETHTFSDWLAVSAWGYGVDDPDELFYGVFPDLSEIMDRDSGPLEMNPKKIRDLFENANRPLHFWLKKFAKNRIFVDLACGLPQFSILPRLFAQLYGFREYWGVDFHIPKNYEITNEFPEFSKDFKTRFFHGDIFEFAEKKLPEAHKLVFVSGLEIKDGLELEIGEHERWRLLQSLYMRLSRDDILLIGDGCPDLDPTTVGFRRITSDHYSFMFSKRHALNWRLRHFFS